MNLAQVRELLGAAPAEGDPATEITRVTEDSRRAGPGCVFVAIRGAHHDGHDHAPDAIERGAAAVLGSDSGRSECGGAPYIRVKHPRRAAGLLAHALAGNPSDQLTVVGVTGTNGKTSTVFLTQAVLRHAGSRTANFGTMGYEIEGEVLPARHTTPFAEDLAAAFTQARERQVANVVMEVSSHALEQERVAGIHFDAAAFTNLTQDHLDYHGDMKTYRAAKLKLFEQVKGEGRFTVVNQADPAAAHFIKASRVPCITFGKGGDVRAKKIEAGMGETVFELRTPWGKDTVRIALLGKHNVLNALCAAAICGGMGVPFAGICEGLGTLPSVPGRFEPIDAGQDFAVVVDYAHTGDGLVNVLSAARKLCKKKVITVFGCGGDRDRGKRPKMGKAAAEGSDFVVLTSDNPRTEDPNRILLDAEMGLQKAGARKREDYLVIPDREEAIRAAIGQAGPGDLVLIAGKGHEDYQILGDERIHFDDREVARAVLEGR